MNTTNQPIKLNSLKNVGLTITVSDEPITLPPELQKEVDQHWQGMVAERPNLFNGPVYSLTDFELTSDSMVVTMAPTNFAHSVYGEHDAGDYTHRVFHSATLVITSDNQIVLGEMGQQTARAGVICFSGGSIDPDDVHDGIVDLAGNTARELDEELGINTSDPAQVVSFAPDYVKTGGPKGKITVVYRADLAITAEEFQKQYDAFVAGLADKGETPEFSRLYIVSNTPEEIAAFLSAYPTLDEYVPLVLAKLS